jgi:hypothetical protein
MAIAYHIHWNRTRNKKFEKQKKPIPENKRTFKFKVKSLPNKKNSKPTETDMLFELDDIKYYKDQLNKKKNIINRSTDEEQTFIFQQKRPQKNEISVHRLETIYEDTPLLTPGEVIQNGRQYTVAHTDFDPIITINDFTDNRNRIIAELLENDEIENNVRNTEVAILDADAQNVHDTDVNKSIRKIYSEIPIVKCNKDDATKLVKEISQYSMGKNNSLCNSEKIQNALREVSSRNSAISNVKDATELDLLLSVWNEAKRRKGDSGINVKDMLIVQISDAYEKSGILCPSGFVNRIATALVVENPERFPKTKRIIEEEMLESAAYVRRELEKDEKYDELSDEEQHNKFKENLMEKLSKDYEGVLSQEDIKSYTAPWIDNI